MTPVLLRGSLADALAEPHDGVSLFWLGQAGFLLRMAQAVILIDPYLSDSLAEKYRGGRFEHRRMMRSPIAPEALPRVDLVLCTHRHGDHMDPGTLPILSRRHPACRFVVPAPEIAHARTVGLHDEALVPAIVGATLHLAGLEIKPVAAAHERLEVDEGGRHRFVGYALAGFGAALYHSGDCVPYEGLIERLAELRLPLALLPVNGRDGERAAAGVPGNFTLDEAATLCRSARIAELVAHHWGMFDFNTCEPARIDALAAASVSPKIVRPSTDRFYRIV